jgi:hypothetical protein
MTYRESASPVDRQRHKPALTIRGKAWAPEHFTVAEPLNGLAGIHRRRVDYAKAEPLYVRVLALMEKGIWAGKSLCR